MMTIAGFDWPEKAGNHKVARACGTAKHGCHQGNTTDIKGSIRFRQAPTRNIPALFTGYDANTTLNCGVYKYNHETPRFSKCGIC